MASVSDTMWTSLYFTGSNEDAFRNNILLLMGRSESSSYKIWVDKNNDLDFSDEQAPILFSDESVDVLLSDLENSDLTFVTRLHKPNPETKKQDWNAAVKYVNKGKPIKGLLFEERQNLRYADVIFRQDSLRIGLLDANINGRYDDVGEDRMIAVGYGARIPTNVGRADGAIVLDSVTYFQSHRLAYQVNEVAADGSIMKIKPALTPNVEESLKPGRKVRDYRFVMASGSGSSLSDHIIDEKLLYLCYWASWCSACIAELDDLKMIHKQYADRVNILGMNYLETESKMNDFIMKHNPPWPNARSTEEMAQDFMIDHGLPRNILINSEGIIVEMNISPSSLVNYLNTK
ncbi:MAG: TlpA family protein disulfide reductase [Bacteroidota bacterium]